jgi:Ni/Fe-hydrogenase subunit HybB-like protein
MNIQLGDIGHIIQLAIAPVFLLNGVCTGLMVLINRLARIIDRSRVLEDRLDIAYNDNYITELDVLYRRSHLINMAITLATACGLFVCLVIALLFIGDTTEVTLDKYIAGLFVAAVFCLIGSFGFLLREIFIASAAMRALRHVRLAPKSND